MINQTIATTAFNQLGLDAMGITSGQLAAKWADAAPVYNRDEMTLTLTATSKWKAMTGGLLQWLPSGASYLSDATGTSLDGIVGVFTIHPQAALRLRRLIGSRYDGRTDGLSERPTPFYVALREGTPEDLADELENMNESSPPLAPLLAAVGDDLSHGILTFHDEQGLIIDPPAVAALFRDLMQTFAALRNDDAGTVADLTASSAGTIGSIVSMGSTKRVHFVDAFGNPWTDITGGAGLRFGTGSRLTTALSDWTTGEGLNLTDTDGSIRFGRSPEGTLGTAEIAEPAFPTTNFPASSTAPALPVQFFRIMVTDLKLHLTGNRTTTSVQDITGVDNKTGNELSPAIREGDTIEFLGDGLTTSGAINEVAVATGLKLIVSPEISGSGALPATRNDRWPAFPATTETAASLDAPTSKLARTTATAKYAADTANVVVTWPAGSLPAEAHVRIFPRVDPGPAIVPLAELDFARRGDGVSGIAHSTGEFVLMLTDPFKTGANPRPSGAILRFDLLIVTRNVTVRPHLLGGLELNVGTGGVAPTIPAVTNSLNAIPLNQRGVSPSPILGLTPTAPAAGSDPVLNALGEAAPRESPRFRTMARNDSIAVSHDGASPGTWNGVVTAGFLTQRSVRGDLQLGNPGNSAGPEEHVPGIKLSGRIANDVARAALRRTHHLIRRLPELDNGRWVLPAAATGTMAGAVLNNIADTVESPELALIPEAVVTGLPGDWSGLMTAIQGFLPGALSSLVGMVPAPDAGDRWVAEVKREAMATKIGRRDSQWAWKWVISKARKLIYIETSLFSPTASEDADHKFDLVKLLKERLEAAPDLKVVLCLPKRIPFAPSYNAFAQRFYLDRTAAIEDLISVAPRRVVAYQPIGFPGRPEVIRGTFAVADDVWGFMGSSTFSRRGLTFDGSIDVTFFDKTISGGVSKNIRQIRKQAMARTLNLSAPAATETPAANWVRLSHPDKAFNLVKEILTRGGDGVIEALWQGLSGTTILPLDKNIADPEGRGFSAALGLFAAVLAELGDSGV